MFADIFPAEMLDQAILADMNFMGVDSKGVPLSGNPRHTRKFRIQFGKYDYWF